MTEVSETKLVPVGQMCIPPYQRPLYPAHVKRLVKRYNPRLVGEIILSARDGVLWVVDGQQRRGMLMELFGAAHQARVEIHYGLSLEEEASMYEELNGNRLRVSVYDQFVGRRDIGGLAETEITAIVEKAGMKIGAWTQDTNQIKAVKILYDAYSKSPELLERVLGTAVEAYGTSNGANHSALLRGLVIVYSHYPEIDDSDLVRKLAQAGTVYTLIGRSKGIGGSGGSVNVANAILEIYNTKKKHNRLPLL